MKLGLGLTIPALSTRPVPSGGGSNVPVFNPSSPAFSTDFTAGILDGSITFTRNSAAQFFGSNSLLQSDAANVPRFDYNPVGNTARGLQMEEARTNSCLRNSALGNAAWTKSNVTANTNSTAGLDGTVSYGDIAATAANGTLTQVISGLATGSTYLFSIDLRRSVGTGTVSISANTAAGYSVELISASYARYTVQGNTGAGTSLTVGVKLATSGDKVFAGSAQLELGSFVTTRINTAGSASQRNQDVAALNLAAAAWFTPDQDFTVYAESEVANMGTGPSTRFVVLSDGTSNNRIIVSADGSSHLTAVASVGSTNYSTPNGATMALSTVYKMAVSYVMGGNLSLSVNGNAPVTLAAVPAQNVAWNELDFGPSSAGGGALWMRNFKYFKGAANATQLAALSA